MLNQVLAELSQPCNEPEVTYLRQVCLCAIDCICKAILQTLHSLSALHRRASEKFISAMWVSTVAASS